MVVAREQIIKQHPEKYQSYDLLAGLLDDSGRALEREKKTEQARAAFAKAAVNYEQSLVINPLRPGPYLHLAELLLGPLKDQERAVRALKEAREHFRQAPEIVYYLAIALREAGVSPDAWTIDAFDLNERSVEAARLGYFGEFSFRQTDPGLRRRYFRPAGRGWELDPAVRALVRFRQANLFDPFVLAGEGPFDLVYIDAWKRDYPRYYEAVVPKLASRGVIVADNLFRGGAVLDPAFSETVRIFVVGSLLVIVNDWLAPMS